MDQGAMTHTNDRKRSSWIQITEKGLATMFKMFTELLTENNFPDQLEVAEIPMTSKSGKYVKAS